jgi:hypothetical protein
MFDTDCVWAVPPAIALAVSIVVCELWRTPPVKGLDLLRAINALYFVLYVFCPLVLINVPVIDVGTWNYIYELNIPGKHVALAELIALVSYYFLLAGFAAAGAIKPLKVVALEVRSRFSSVSSDTADRWLLCANILIGIGVVSLVKYTLVIGGVWNLLTWGMLYRSTPMPTDSPWVFLKNVVLVTGPASLFYYAWAQFRGGIWRWTLFGFSVFIAIVALFHHGGRLQIFMYVFTFPIAAAILGRGIRAVHILSTFLVGAVLVFVGKEILFLFYNPAAVATSVESAGRDLAAVLFRATLEFSFPFLTLAKSISYVPFDEAYRWFLDIYYGFVSLLPQRVTGTELPRTVSLVVLEMENTPNPADLLTFGYFSLGVPGCLSVAFAFGVLSRFIEDVLSEPTNRMQAVLFVAWIMFWAFRLMYGDPSQAILGGFHLALGTALLLIQPSGSTSRALLRG